MADIKITKKINNTETETSIELLNVNNTDLELAKSILDALNQKQQAQETDSVFKTISPEPYTIRRIQECYISPETLKAAIQTKTLDKVIMPYDEIDITLDTGEIVTVVCGYSSPHMARFVFKDCIAEIAMFDEPTNKDGYYHSKGREYVLHNIYPRLPQEWRDLIKTRKLVERFNGKKFEYEDTMWLLSSTDVFGLSTDNLWTDLDDSFQLSIFKKDKQRIKTYQDAVVSYWLRSISQGTTTHTEMVNVDGTDGNGNVKSTRGIVPCFDIG